MACLETGASCNASVADSQGVAGRIGKPAIGIGRTTTDTLGAPTNLIAAAVGVSRARLVAKTEFLGAIVHLWVDRLAAGGTAASRVASRVDRTINAAYPIETKAPGDGSAITRIGTTSAREHGASRYTMELCGIASGKHAARFSRRTGYVRVIGLLRRQWVAMRKANAGDATIVGRVAHARPIRGAIRSHRTCLVAEAQLLGSVEIGNLEALAGALNAVGASNSAIRSAGPFSIRIKKTAVTDHALGTRRAARICRAGACARFTGDERSFARIYFHEARRTGGASEMGRVRLFGRHRVAVRIANLPSHSARAAVRILYYPIVA